MSENRAELIRALCELGNSQYMKAIPADPYTAVIAETAMAVVNSVRVEYGLEKIDLQSCGRR